MNSCKSGTLEVMGCYHSWAMHIFSLQQKAYNIVDDDTYCSRWPVPQVGSGDAGGTGVVLGSAGNHTNTPLRIRYGIQQGMVMGAVGVMFSLLALHAGDQGSSHIMNLNHNVVPWQFGSCLKWRSRANKPWRDEWLVVWKTKTKIEQAVTSRSQYDFIMKIYM